jgi:hypothetical protein
VTSRLVLLSLAAMGPSDFALAAEQSMVEHHLIPIASESAARCGMFRRAPASLPGPVLLSREESRTVSQCITAAHRQRRGFFFSVETPGADVSLAGGLVGEPSGAIRQFHYRVGCRPRRDDEPGLGPKVRRAVHDNTVPGSEDGAGHQPEHDVSIAGWRPNKALKLTARDGTRGRLWSAAA